MMQEIDDRLDAISAPSLDATTLPADRDVRPQALRIAIVEDDECLADLLLYNLQETVCTVEWIADGLDALARFQAARPDVVVLDWMLPRLSGIEILRRMRLDGNLRDVPVLMLTGRTSEGDRRRALLAGATGFITKPFSVKALICRTVELGSNARRDEIRRTRDAVVESANAGPDIAMSTDAAIGRTRGEV